METKRIKIEDMMRIEETLKIPAEIIKNGGLVAFPTETVYGLGADALNETAARKIYEAKGRPSDNPLIAHIGEIDMLNLLTDHISSQARQLIQAFWPGPLTLIFEKKPEVPEGTTGGLNTIAVRMPEDPVARMLIRLAEVPIAAPSANLSGRPSPTTADHVWNDMRGRIDMLIDHGEAGIGLESTILDITGGKPIILRPGAITREMIKSVLGIDPELDPAITGPLDSQIKPKAPGMKYKHYAPKADMILVEGTMEQMISQIRLMVEQYIEKGLKVGIICTEETKSHYPQGIIRSMGSRRSESDIAHNLYGVLREFDDLDVDYIISETIPDNCLGQAIMNRLTKAAGYQIWKPDRRK